MLWQTEKQSCEIRPLSQSRMALQQKGRRPLTTLSGQDASEVDSSPAKAALGHEVSLSFVHLGNSRNWKSTRNYLSAIYSFYLPASHVAPTLGGVKN